MAYHIYVDEITYPCTKINADLLVKEPPANMVYPFIWFALTPSSQHHAVNIYT